MKKLSLFITFLAITGCSLSLFSNQLSLAEKWNTDTEIVQKKQRFEEYRKWRADIQNIVDHVEKRSGLKNLMILETIFPNEKMEALYQDIISDGIKKGITSEMAFNKTIAKSTIEWATLFSRILKNELNVAQSKLNSFSESPYGQSVKGYLEIYPLLPSWKQLLFRNQKNKIEKEYNDQLEALQNEKDKMVKEVNNINNFLWIKELGFKEQYGS